MFKDPDGESLYNIFGDGFRAEILPSSTRNVPRALQDAIADAIEKGLVTRANERAYAEIIRGRNPFFAFRRAYGLKSDIVANTLGMTEDFYLAVERGMEQMSGHQIVRFCQTFGITPVDLLKPDYARIKKCPPYAFVEALFLMAWSDQNAPYARYRCAEELRGIRNYFDVHTDNVPKGDSTMQFLANIRGLLTSCGWRPDTMVSGDFRQVTQDEKLHVFFENGRTFSPRASLPTRSDVDGCCDLMMRDFSAIIDECTRAINQHTSDMMKFSEPVRAISFRLFEHGKSDKARKDCMAYMKKHTKGSDNPWQVLKQGLLSKAPELYVRKLFTPQMISGRVFASREKLIETFVDFWRDDAGRNRDASADECTKLRERRKAAKKGLEFSTKIMNAHGSIAHEEIVDQARSFLLLYTADLSGLSATVNRLMGINVRALPAPAPRLLLASQK